MSVLLEQHHTQGTIDEARRRINIMPSLLNATEF
jgi:hypothetical protein